MEITGRDQEQAHAGNENHRPDGHLQNPNETYKAIRRIHLWPSRKSVSESKEGEVFGNIWERFLASE